jgi:hypothetical protein
MPVFFEKIMIEQKLEANMANPGEACAFDG